MIIIKSTFLLGFDEMFAVQYKFIPFMCVSACARTALLIFTVQSLSLS